MNTDLSKLEQEIGYSFKDKQLLINALTHSSFIFEHQKSDRVCNERLEFLGDAVLELISSEFLYKNFPNLSEGDMSKKRASLVCEDSLAYECAKFSLGEYLWLGYGEEKCGGRKRASITSDACEALIGAIFLDGGFTSAKDFITKYILNDIERKNLFYDSKSTLQEMIQEKYKISPDYELIKEEGPDHDKVFEYVVKLNEEVLGRGTGKNKKSAQQAAAYDAIINYNQLK